VNLNDLLIWMSARVKGSWQQFRSAVEEFHVEPENTGEDRENTDDVTWSDLPLYQAVRLSLQRLGHVEFFSASGEDWRVVPPSLAITKQGSQWVGVVCGARPPYLSGLLNQLSSAISWDSQEIPDMPDRIRIAALDLQVLCQAATDMGLAVQKDAPVSILAAIPPVDDPRSRFPKEAPGVPGWTVERFSALKLRWEGADSGDVEHTKNGLFRFRMKYQRFHFLRWQGRSFQVQVQVGKYAVLRHHRIRKLVSYNSNQAILSVPVTCRPPLLMERALVLCSGILPRIDKASGLLKYTEIPRDVAQLAAELLRQEIQII